MRLPSPFAVTLAGCAALAAIAALVDCTAKVTESCVTGPCELSASVSVAVTTASSSAGGGASMCGHAGAGGMGAGGMGSGGRGAGGEDPSCCPKPPAAGDYPCDVFAILKQKCHPCHAPDQLMNSGAPFGLLTWEDTQKLYGVTTTPRWVVMDHVTSPDGPGEYTRMPFGCPQNCPPSGDLTPAQRATLQRWLNHCATPLGDGKGKSCAPPSD